MRAFALIVATVAMAYAQPKSEIVGWPESTSSWLWRPQLVNSEIRWELNQKESRLAWHGEPIMGSGHDGTLQITSGYLTISPQGQIMQGELVMDMTTIKNTDMKPDDGGKDLEDHLKSDDFFSVATFPGATFSILKTVPDATYKTTGRIKIFGRLTLKGVSHPVELIATTIRHKETIHAKGELLLDRTKWGINYQSQSIIKSLKDGIISDVIKITFDVRFFVGC